MVTHGSYDAKGVEDVLDLDPSGPELLEQDYWGNLMDDPGYYVTTLYQQRGPYWYRSDGRHGSHVFPAFEKWSVMWSGRPPELVASAPHKRPLRDSSNDPAAGIHTKILGTTESLVRVSPEVGWESVHVSVFVTDSADGRTIDLQPDQQIACGVGARAENSRLDRSVPLARNEGMRFLDLVGIDWPVILRSDTHFTPARSPRL